MKLVVHRFPHWRTFAERRVERTPSLISSLEKISPGSYALRSTVSYTRNYSYICSSNASISCGLDAYEKERFLSDHLKAFMSTRGKNVDLLYISRQEAIFKSLEFFDIAVGDDGEGQSIRFSGIFHEIDNGVDKVVIFFKEPCDIDIVMQVHE